MQYGYAFLAGKFEILCSDIQSLYIVRGVQLAGHVTCAPLTHMAAPPLLCAPVCHFCRKCTLARSSNEGLQSPKAD